MAAIVVKTELPEIEDIKPLIKEGGGAAAAGVVGVKTIVVEKTQAALKVANEAKQLNLRLKEQKQLQPQPQTPIAPPRTKRRNSAGPEEKDGSKSNKMAYPVGNKRFRAYAPMPSKQHSTPKPLAQPPRSSSRCGEIFVTKNAKKWTFVCTFCQKTTRDIGEFVCHIKFKHMNGNYNDDEDEDEHINTDQMYNNTMDEQYNNSHDQDVRSLTNHNYKLEDLKLATKINYLSTLIPKIPTIMQVSSMVTTKTTNSVNNNTSNEYFDCTNYLDVNVHTDPDELSYNGGQNKRPQPLKAATKTKIKEHINKSKAQKEKEKYVVNLLDDDEEDNENDGNPNDSQFNSEIFDYDVDEEEDDDGVEIVEDDDEMLAAMDGEDDQLAFLRAESLDDDFKGGIVMNEGREGGGGSSGRGSKKYRSHVRGKAYCNLCDKEFQYYSLYRNHMIKHSNVTPYKCQYCSKAFKSKQAIRYHMNTHTKQVQYNCPLCPITYGSENQFVTHVLNHESETCFPCMVCAKILKSDQEREEHLETHTEERPFGCEYCNKRFRQKHHLSNHLKLHCQYRCDFCKAEFASTQTQRRPYACPSCEEYPDVRQRVEKQRAKAPNNAEVNPLEIAFENVAQEVDTEGVDLAEMVSDEESETSLLIGPDGQKRVPCKYCTRTYKHNSALNYHMRMKHPHEWKIKQ